MTRFQLVILAFAATAALGCAQEEEVIYIEPEPVAAQPAYSKY